MYARVWGIPENNIGAYVDNLLEILYLQSQAEKFIYTLRWAHMLVLPLQQYSDPFHVWYLTCLEWIANSLTKLRSRQAKTEVLKCSAVK